MGMAVFNLALVLLCAVLVSSVLERFLPRVSLPLVQVLIGLVIALVGRGTLLPEMDPELFLVLFIAPLLFDESRHVSLSAIISDWRAIASLGIGLVLVTAVVVGLVLSWMMPAIPVAAAIALGASVGPTDAAAVYALSRDVAVTKRQDSLLSAESLFNDASGVVTFQFAVAAALTGTFSVAEASVSFLVTFLGGIACGLILGALATAILSALAQAGLEGTSTRVAFEVLAPFAIYLAAHGLGVSGILAVVAAGMVMAAKPRKRTPDTARMALASSTVWEFLTFIINGVVFVLLGMEIPSAISPSWRSPELSNFDLVCAALVVCALVIALRFGWCVAMELIRMRRLGCSRGGGDGTARGGSTLAEALRSAAILTLAGPKGAVTLSIIMTLPYLTATGAPFPERNVLVFIACVVIVVTLLLANFVMPLVAPTDESATEEGRALDDARLAVLEPVVRQLAQRPQGQGAQLAARRFVLAGYGERIARARSRTADPQLMALLRMETIDHQRAAVMAATSEHAIDGLVYERYDRQLARLETMTSRLLCGDATPEFCRRYHLSALGAMVRAGLSSLRDLGSGDDHEQDLRLLAEAGQTAAIAYLSAETRSEDGERARAARLLLSDHWALLSSLREHDQMPPLVVETGAGSRRPRDLSSLARENDADPGEVRRLVRSLTSEGLRLELARIEELQGSGEISHGEAAELTEEVHVMQLGL